MRKCLNSDLIGVRAEPAEQIALARQFGFDAVDLAIPQIDDAAAVREVMDNLGIEPGCASGLLPVRTTASEQEWAEAIAALPSALEIARTLGFTRTTMVLMPFHESLAYAECMKLHVERLRQAAEMLAAAGVRIGIEYVSPQTRRAGQPNVFLHDLAGCLQLIEAVGHPGIGLLLDSFHWYCAGESVQDIQALSAEQVVAVHVNDAIEDRPVESQVAFERELPAATGVIDIAGFINALRTIGYEGPITCEPMYAPLKTMSTEQAMKAVSRAMDDVLKTSPC